MEDDTLDVPKDIPSNEDEFDVEDGEVPIIEDTDDDSEEEEFE